MKRQMLQAILMTVVTTILLGVLYPLAVTAAAHLLFRDKADGQLVNRGDEAVGSRLLGQSFTGDNYFHSRPSAAGNGYDPLNSGGSNLGPTSRKWVDQVEERRKTESDGSKPVPVDLVTASASGLDPEITPAAAAYQAARVAHARNLPITQVQELISRNTRPRQFGLFGEPGVNVLELNLALDATKP